MALCSPPKAYSSIIYSFIFIHYVLHEAGIDMSSIICGFHITLRRWDTVRFFETKDFKDSHLKF